MTLKHDLLYLIEEDGYHVDKDLANDLRLKEAFRMADADYFIEVLLSPLIRKENIEYRREIINDFLSVPDLFRRLFSAFSKLEDQIKTRQRDFTVSSAVRRINNSRDFYSSKNSAQMNCAYFRNDLLILRDIDKTLCKFDIVSTGLKEIKKRISEIVNDPDYIKLIDILKSVENINVDDEFLMCFETGELGKMKDYDILCFEEEEKYTARSFFRRMKSEINISAEASLTNIRNEYLARRLDDISSAAVMMDRMIFREFIPIARQLCFYRAALDFIGTVRDEKGFPIVFSDICENETVIEDLYDVKLISDGKNVIPNDVKIPEDICGMVIIGENNTGKTVFIRSVGIAQLLFSAGLPIVAKSARMSLVKGIFSQFSASEKEDASDCEAGRFEQEVKILAGMFEKINSGSIVFLNESFQTTEYSEGAEGLYHILKAINHIGSKWILVTHLKEISNYFNSKNVCKYEMSSDGSHRIRRTDL